MRAIAVPLLLVACAAATAEPRFPGPGDYDLSLEHQGRRRTYLLHLPAVRPDRPLPLVLAFHGGGGRAAGFRDYAGLDAVADREGFAVVYPDGTGRLGRRLLTWNAGGCCGYAMREKVDDVGFVLAVLDDLARDLPIDPERVYATGHSNGAMMSYRLAAEAADRVAAIAPVAGAMMLDDFAPSRPVPVLHIHSVDDPRALYAGGLGPPFPLTRHRVQHRPVEEGLARWTLRDGCPGQAREVERRVDPETGHGAVLYVWAPCRDGVEVALWKLTGPGHGWPGAPARRERLIGPPTRVVDAAEEIWAFFRRFPAPAAPP